MDCSTCWWLLKRFVSERSLTIPCYCSYSAPPTKRWIPTLCETVFNRYLWNSQSTWKVEVFESQLFFNFGSRWVISEFSMRIFGAIFCRYFYVKRWRDQAHIRIVGQKMAKMHILKSERTHLDPKLKNYCGPKTVTFHVKRYLSKND